MVDILTGHLFIGESYDDNHTVNVRENFSDMLETAMLTYAEDLTDRLTVPSKNRAFFDKANINRLRRKRHEAL